MIIFYIQFAGSNIYKIHKQMSLKIICLKKWKFLELQISCKHQMAQTLLKGFCTLELQFELKFNKAIIFLNNFWTCLKYI